MRLRRLLAVVGGGAILLVLADFLFPPDLRRFTETSPVLLAKDGSALNVATTRDGKWRLATRPEVVDPHYVEMLLAAEDQRFRDHHGVDPLALGRAAWQMARTGRIVSGGSTLTMQVARLLEPHRRSWLGKLHDIIRAGQLEERYDKDQILGMYLTLAPFGGNVEGVRAAALDWFGHEPDRLTAGEAAILVALPQRPAALRPDRHPEAARQAAERVLDRLVTEARIPAGDLDMTPPAIGTRHGFPRFAGPLAQRLRPAKGGEIATRLDAGVQRSVEALAGEAQALTADGGEIAILVVENRTREIRAWAGGVHSALDLAGRRRSPGSTLKPFIYGLAFDDLALLPETLVDDRPMRFGDYAPENFDRGFRGQIPASDALQQSLNVPAIALLDRVGPGRLAAILREAGARLDFPSESGPPSLPLALGGVGISLVDLTRLYVALARGGESVPLHLTGPALHGGAPVMSARAASLITGILRLSPPPDGRLPGVLAVEGRPIAYKTGTSYGFRDAWAMGYSPTWTVGIWVGRPDGSPRPGLYGRNTAAPLLFSVFDRLPAETEPDPLAPRVQADDAVSAPVVPLGLRRFAGRDAGQVGTSPPHILYPPDGAIVDLSLEDGGRSALSLEAEGGVPPYRWSVNGIPVAAPSTLGAPQWQPDGPGYARISVLDRAGHRASATIDLR